MPANTNSWFSKYTGRNSFKKRSWILLLQVLVAKIERNTLPGINFHPRTRWYLSGGILWFSRASYLSIKKAIASIWRHLGYFWRKSIMAESTESTVKKYTMRMMQLPEWCWVCLSTCIWGSPEFTFIWYVNRVGEPIDEWCPSSVAFTSEAPVKGTFYKAEAFSANKQKCVCLKEKKYTYTHIYIYMKGVMCL